MELVFERGKGDSPKGHALLYFRNVADNEDIWATYLMVLPVNVDISKYVPPFLASQMTGMGAKEFSSFAFPPAPEKLGSHRRLLQLAELRDDDILYGGVIRVEDVTSILYSVSETLQRYTRIYHDHAAALDSREGEAHEELGVSQVLYSLMSESDRLAELTKLVGRLRFAVEGADQSMVQETAAEIEALSRHFPKDHQINQLIAAARMPGERGTKLADLYIQRCYLLSRQEYEGLRSLEERINALKSPGHQQE